MFPFRKKVSVSKDNAEAAPAIALIVEDEPILLMNATAMLEDMGFSVLGVDTAEEAIPILETNDVELLITDIHMPGDGDGLALAKTTAQRWPDVRIVICSGKTRVLESQLPARATFVGKPYTVDDIEHAILSL